MPQNIIVDSYHLQREITQKRKIDNRSTKNKTAQKTKMSAICILVQIADK